MSAIFYHNEEQKSLAEKSLKAAQQKSSRPIQTKILENSAFYDAEDYHQKYLLQRHPWLMNVLDIEPGTELNDSHIAARLNGYVGGYGNFAAFEAELPKLNLDEKTADYVRNIMKREKRGNF